jgi:hypothetical protein
MSGEEDPQAVSRESYRTKINQTISMSISLQFIMRAKQCIAEVVEHLLPMAAMAALRDNRTCAATDATSQTQPRRPCSPALAQPARVACTRHAPTPCFRLQLRRQCGWAMMTQARAAKPPRRHPGLYLHWWGGGDHVAHFLHWCGGGDHAPHFLHWWGRESR